MRLSGTAVGAAAAIHAGPNLCGDQADSEGVGRGPGGVNRKTVVLTPGRRGLSAKKWMKQNRAQI